MSDRALKFRALDTTTKRMILLELQHVSSFSHSDYYKLMLWTGLKDEMENDIYEGDIMSIEGLFETNYAQVIWGVSQPLSSWDLAETWLLRFADRIVDSEHKRVVGPLYPYCQERCGYKVLVVGNVYQNPELVRNK